MWNDVVDLSAFYTTPLGQVVRQAIGLQLREIWPDLQGRQLVGLGYATPYLAPFRGEAARSIAAMPAGQGALPWPHGARGLTLLAEETALPFADRSVDRLLLIHGLEFGEPPNEMLREIWRVLVDDGQLVVVVPARRGMWSSSDRTPFDQGQPYSMSLYLPPIGSPTLLRGAAAWERVGRRWFSRFAGVLLVEASKEIYAAAPLRRLKRRRTILLPASS